MVLPHLRQGLASWRVPPNREQGEQRDARGEEEGDSAKVRYSLGGLRLIGSRFIADDLEQGAREHQRAGDGEAQGQAKHSRIAGVPVHPGADLVDFRDIGHHGVGHGQHETISEPESGVQCDKKKHRQGKTQAPEGEEMRWRHQRKQEERG